MRVVLIRLSALGDIVHTWPLAAAIRQAKPKIHLSWVVEEPLRLLVEHHPAVDAVVTTATRRWRRKPLAAGTRAEIAVLKSSFAELQPDLCIDAQGVFKSALISRWTAAGEIVGLARPWRREALPGLFYSRAVNGSRTHRHVVATNLELVRAVGGTPPAQPTRPDGSWLADRVRPRLPQGDWATPFAVLLPGAGHPAKILPVAVLAKVARGLVERGVQVVVVWGPAEEDRARAVCAFAGRGIFLAPPTDLGELAALLDAASLVVGGDTGPVHLSAAVGTPTVGTFISTDWRRNGPLGERVEVVSAVAEDDHGPTGSARARAVRRVGAGEILAAADRAMQGQGH